MHKRKELPAGRYMKTFAAMLVTLATMLACVLIGPVHAYAEEYNISDLGWVDKDDTSFEISSDGGKTWKPYISGMQVNYGDQIRTELHWKVPNDVKINEGDTFVYDLPSNLEYKSNEKYPISTTVATWSATTPSTATKWWPPTPAANRRGPTSKRS